MSRVETKGGPFHAVRFYEDDTSLCRIVSGFIAEGVAIGQPALVIASAPHNECILDNLRVAGIDVGRLQQNNELLLLDAREMLNLFMDDEMPNPDRFREVAAAALRRVGGGRDRTMRCYGEMVDLLWNNLAGTHDFSLLCGYAMGNFYKDVTIEDVCRHHTHRVLDTGETSATAH